MSERGTSAVDRCRGECLSPDKARSHLPVKCGNKAADNSKMANPAAAAAAACTVNQRRDLLLLLNVERQNSPPLYVCVMAPMCDKPRCPIDARR